MSSQDKSDMLEKEILDFIRRRELSRAANGSVTDTVEGLGDLEETWNAFELLDPTQFPEFDAQVQKTPASVEPQKSRSLGQFIKELFSFGPIRQEVYSMAAAASFAVASVMLFVLVPQYYGIPQKYDSSAGGVVAIDYQDGSRVTLDEASEIEITDSWKYRKADLLDGLAYFEIAKNPDMPFTIEVGDTLVTVLGTAFSIYHDASLTEIVVEEGKVRVQNNTLPKELDEILTKNHKIEIFGDHFVLTQGVDVQREMAWQDGMLYFDNEPLVTITKRLNRYYQKPVTISGTELGKIRLSGFFSKTDKESFVQALQEITSVQVVETESSTTLK